MRTKRYAMQYRRKREGRTDYRKRASLVLSGKTRFVIRRTGTRMIVQAVVFEPKGDRIILTADSKSLEKLGWKSGLNTSTSYLTGYLAGVLAKSKKIESGISDLGARAGHKGGRMYAAIKGLVDAGVEVPHDPEVLPKADRINGTHLKNGAKVSQEISAVKNKIKPKE